MLLQQVISNLNVGRARRVWENGRETIVAPMSLIMHNHVLAGSQGPLLYPVDEISANYREWDGTPILAYHPIGANSARDRGVMERQGIGTARRPSNNGKLGAYGHFDREKTQAADKRFGTDIWNRLDRCVAGDCQPLELSTGLFTTNVPAPRGSASNGREYTHIATAYVPDHVAILPGQVGACSVADGCGAMIAVNANPEGVNQYSHMMGGQKQHEVLAAHGYTHEGLKDEGSKQFRTLASGFVKKQGEETHRVTTEDARTKEGKNIGKWRSEHTTADDYKTAYGTGSKSLKEHLDSIHGEATKNAGGGKDKDCGTGGWGGGKTPVGVTGNANPEGINQYSGAAGIASGYHHAASLSDADHAKVHEAIDSASKSDLHAARELMGRSRFEGTRDKLASMVKESIDTRRDATKKVDRMNRNPFAKNSRADELEACEEDCDDDEDCIDECLDEVENAADEQSAPAKKCKCGGTCAACAHELSENVSEVGDLLLNCGGQGGTPGPCKSGGAETKTQQQTKMARGSTGRANAATARANEADSHLAHKMAAGEHQKASNMHVRAGNAAIKAGDKETALKHFTMAARHEKTMSKHNDLAEKKAKSFELETHNAGRYGNPQHAETGQYLPHGAGTGKGPVHEGARGGAEPTAEELALAAQRRNAIMPTKNQKRGLLRIVGEYFGILNKADPGGTADGPGTAGAPNMPGDDGRDIDTLIKQPSPKIDDHDDELNEQQDAEQSHTQFHERDAAETVGNAALDALWAVYNRDWPQSKRDDLDEKDFAGPGQSFPIATQEDLDAAVHSMGRAKDPDAVKAGIKRIAERKGLKLPDTDTWNTNLEDAMGTENCGGKGGTPGPCKVGGGKGAGGKKGKAIELKEASPRDHSNHAYDKTEHAEQANTAASHKEAADAHRAAQGANSSGLIRDMHQQMIDHHEAAAKRLTRNEKVCNCGAPVANAGGVCTNCGGMVMKTENCGGKGGQPGPCASEGLAKAAHAATAAASGHGNAGLHHAAAQLHKAASEQFKAEGNQSGARQHAYMAKAHGEVEKDSAGKQFQTNQQLRGGDMTQNERRSMTDFIVANCACWKPEEEKKVLNRMTSEQLQLIHAGAVTANAKKAEGEDDEEKDQEDSSLPAFMQKNEKAQGSNADVSASSGTVESGGEATAGYDDEDADKKKAAKNRASRLESRMTPAELEVWNSAKQVVAEQRAALINRLIANVADKKQRKATFNKFFDDPRMTVPELKTLVSLVPAPARNRQTVTSTPEARDAFSVYSGAAGAADGIVDNSGYDEDDELPLPTVNWAAEQEQQRQRDRDRQTA